MEMSSYMGNKNGSSKEDSSQKQIMPTRLKPVALKLARLEQTTTNIDENLRTQIWALSVWQTLSLCI